MNQNVIVAVDHSAQAENAVKCLYLCIHVSCVLLFSFTLITPVTIMRSCASQAAASTTGRAAANE